MSIPGPCLDEKLWRLGKAMRAGHLDEWGFNFVKSILGQAKRPGWQPSAKQDAILTKLLSEASKPAGANPGSLIDDEDTIATRRA